MGLFLAIAVEVGITFLDFNYIWPIVKPWSLLVTHTYWSYILGYKLVEFFCLCGFFCWLEVKLGFRESGKKLATVARRFQHNEMAMEMDENAVN